MSLLNHMDVFPFLFGDAFEFAGVVHGSSIIGRQPATKKTEGLRVSMARVWQLI